MPYCLTPHKEKTIWMTDKVAIQVRGGWQQVSGIALAEGGILAALSVILALGCTYYPFLQLFTNFIAPLPLTILVLRQGIKPAFLSSLIIAVLLFIFLGLQGLLLALSIIAPGMVLGYGIKKKWAPVFILLSVAAASGLAMGLVVLSYGLFFKATFVAEITKALEESQRLALETYKRMQIPQTELARQEGQFKMTSQFLILALPAILIASSILMSFFNYLIAERLLKRFGYYLQPFPDFSLWRAPWITSLGYVLAVIAMLAGNSIPGFKQVGLNLFFVFSVWYLIQGLAVVAFYIKQTRLSKLLKTGIIFGAMVLLGNFLSIAGLLDTWLDFRRIEIRQAAGCKGISGGRS